MIAHRSANMTMEAFYTLRCQKFSFVQVGRSGSNQIIGGRRVHCNDDDDDDDDDEVINNDTMIA